MAKYTGVRENSDGSWYYRIKVKNPAGKLIDTMRKQDDNGMPFMTARAAHEARVSHLAIIMSEQPVVAPEAVQAVITLSDVYNDYLNTDGRSRAPATLRKQDSMWRNHINKRFGDCDINTIDIIDLQFFLSELYNQYAYKYVEGFLKFFYLLFNHAYKREWFDVNRYVKMFATKGTQLEMPKISQLDKEKQDAGAIVYSLDELDEIESVFNSEDGNLLLAYYLGLYAGLRIGECFGLRWSNINWQEQTITIDRQLQYIDNKFCLCPVKTLAARREFIIPQFLYEQLEFAYTEQNALKSRLRASYRDTERVYDMVTNEWIVGGDFVNRKKNGELLTINSIKYWSRKIKSETGIEFKYHNLRHTFATECAVNNVNAQMLMHMMGHLKLDTTMKYYINIHKHKTLQERTKQIIDNMYQRHDDVGKFFRES